LLDFISLVLHIRFKTVFICYLVGDDDLLEIIGQSKNPTSIQSHMKKLFSGIASVQFNEDRSAILAICSSDQEVVKLKRPVNLTPNVEEWLSRLVDEMKNTLKHSLLDCFSRGIDFMTYPQQTGM
jgi:dynein heavy chain 2